MTKPCCSRHFPRESRSITFCAFDRNFISADGELKVSEEERQAAIAICEQADPGAAAACMASFANADFRPDLATIAVPTLALHGDAAATVPLEGSGARTHRAVAGSELVVLTGACMASM